MYIVKVKIYRLNRYLIMYYINNLFSILFIYMSDTINKAVSQVSNLPNVKKLLLIIIIIVFVTLIISVFSSVSQYKNVVNKSINNIKKLVRNTTGDGDIENEDSSEDEDENEADNVSNDANEEDDASDDNNVKKIALSPTKLNLTLFYADWCGHCQQFKKQSWGKLLETYNNHDSIILHELDCTNIKTAINTPGGKSIKGFPTLVFNYINSKKKPIEIEYSGSREADALSNFINKIVKKLNKN